MKEFEPLISSVGEPAEMPDSVSIIGGAPEGDPQPMHYHAGDQWEIDFPIKYFRK